MWVRWMVAHTFSDASVTDFFAPKRPDSVLAMKMPMSGPPPSVPASPTMVLPHLCVHLQGPEYEDYISRTTTRTLGGISMKLRGSLIRKALPYKSFPKLESEAQGAAENVVLIPTTSARVPPEGNKHIDEGRWTEAEKKKVDAWLKSAAR